MTKKGEKLIPDVLKTLGAASWWCNKTSPRATVTEKSVYHLVTYVDLVSHMCICCFTNVGQRSTLHTVSTHKPTHSHDR